MDYNTTKNLIMENFDDFFDFIFSCHPSVFEDYLEDLYDIV